jgi:serine/threonine protein kinase
MGEVYKARDTRLDRRVAIKVMQPRVAVGPQFRGRLEREARAISKLQHPYICTLYDVGEVEGTAFLVMELLQGQTLAERLKTGALPLDEALKIAIEVADGLSTAHNQGIVHRDLKPANIMLTKRGAKLLDFGLAKAAAPVVSIATSSTQQTASTAVTGSGTILGTPHYMSPEQVEGKNLDSRSDLFSLGTVLYEMSTGVRPFNGETLLSTMTSILRDSPRPVTELNASLPNELARIVGHALVKDPERRYQTAQDLRNNLEELKASRDSGDRAVLSLRQRSPLLQAAVAIVLVAVASGVAIYEGVQRRAPTGRLQITQLTTSGNAERPAISPDGKFAAYIQHQGSEYSLRIRQISTASDVEVVPPEPNVTLLGATITPDEGFIDFVRWYGSAEFMEVWRVPLLGGTSRRLIEHADSRIGWSPDGRHLAFVRTARNDGRTALIVADRDGADERVLAARQSPRDYVALSHGFLRASPAWSPHGRVIALIGTDNDMAQAVFVDTVNGAEQVVALSGLEAISGPAWIDRNTLVVNGTAEHAELQQLWRLSYPAGQLTPLTNDLSSFLRGQRHGEWA